MRWTDNAGNQSQQILAGRSDFQGPDVARLMITKRPGQRPQIELQLSLLMQPPQIGAGFAGVGGHGAGIVVVDQMQIFVRQAEHRRRLRRHDVITLPHRLGQ